MFSPTTVCVTSLAPTSRSGIQEQAVDSWVALGAQVISANTVDEIERLSPLFPHVTFIPLQRTAEKDAGRPVPYIDDLLNLCVEYQVNGHAILINADIVFAPRPKTLAQLIAATHHQKLICGVRVDVDDTKEALQALEGGTSITGELSGGYDYFFLPPALLSSFAAHPPQSNLAVGMPFWDYWLPLEAMIRCVDTVSASLPFALHNRHPTRWDATKFDFFRHFLRALIGAETPRLSANESKQSFYSAMLWAMISKEHDALLAARDQQPLESDARKDAHVALADFYDRQFSLLVHHLRAMTPPVKLS